MRGGDACYACEGCSDGDDEGWLPPRRSPSCLPVSPPPFETQMPTPMPVPSLACLTRRLPVRRRLRTAAVSFTQVGSPSVRSTASETICGEAYSTSLRIFAQLTPRASSLASTRDWALCSSSVLQLARSSIYLSIRWLARLIRVSKH